MPFVEPWKTDGPELPLEFSRISKDGRLTLVIDELNGADCLSLYAYNPRTSIIGVMRDLRTREGTTEKWIGYYNHRTKECSIEKYTEQVNITNILSGWCDRHDVDGVVWTALLSNFSLKRDTAFSVEGAITYLKGLKKCAETCTGIFSKRSSPD